jgi:hypothetical protein
MCLEKQVNAFGYGHKGEFCVFRDSFQGWIEQTVVRMRWLEVDLRGIVNSRFSVVAAFRVREHTSCRLVWCGRRLE